LRSTYKWHLLLAILLVMSALSLVDAPSASPRQHETLQSFYIARFYFSDMLSDWSDQILDVSPVEDGVRVRVIRVSQANDYCPGVIVRAAERVIPRSTVREIAGADICAFTPARVEAALKAAAPAGASDPSDSATETIIARCGTGEREIDFPYPVEVDQKALKRSNLQVAHLWDTNYKIYRRIFGKGFSFVNPPPDQEKQLEQLGNEIVPELVSGKYQTAFADTKCGDHECGNYLEWRLEGYTKAPEPYDPYSVTLLHADSLHLTKYVTPRMPPIAKLANVTGDVQLQIVVDPKTGSVTTVDMLSGRALLRNSVITAAQSWQFDPAFLSGQPLEATVRFEKHCR
jgi:hypothetical protein